MFGFPVGLLKETSTRLLRSGSRTCSLVYPAGQTKSEAAQL